MSKIVHILLFVFFSEISHHVLAESQARCEELQPPKHGSVILHGERTVGSLATFSCDPDKRLHGAATTKCLITGQWTFNPPRCLSSCSVPIIKNGEMGKIQTRPASWRTYKEFMKVFPGEQIIPNQALLLRCENGFLPIEDSKFLESNLLEVICNDGVWSKVLRCEQTSCTGEPPAIKNGKPVVNSREHGYTLWYRCNNQVHVKVMGNVKCQFGTWMGTAPKCLNYPCFTRDLNYPGLVKPPHEYLESQESFEIECENGFRRATSARKINCNEGKWDISQNPCTDDITCPWFTPDNGLNVSYSNENKAESWATFSCAVNAKLVGTRYAGCRRDGIWTSTQPYCEDREKHGTISTTPPGTTSPEECFCTYDYENLFVKAQIGHKKLKRGDNIMRGETVSFECKFVGGVLSWQNGIRFFGKANMTCNTCKKWQSKDLPTCNYTERNDAVIGCEDHLKILPGGVVDMRKGESRQFFCSSTWKQPQWDYGGKKDVSVNITQVSEQGNVIFVSLLDIMRANHEQSGKYECFMRGERDLRIGSSFLHLQTDDYVSCSRFSHSVELKVTYSRNVSVGSIATFSCTPSSKNLIGSSVSVCRENGSWSNPLPSCEESKCSVHDLSISVPEDVVPDMTGVNGEFLPSGSVVELKCSDNSIINGNSRALCGEHGKWEFGSFQCVPGCILNIDRSSHLLVQPVKDSYRLGEFLLLSCPPGERLSNDVERLMCLGGRWSDSMPDCKESEEKGQPGL